MPPLLTRSSSRYSHRTLLATNVRHLVFSGNTIHSFRSVSETVSGKHDTVTSGITYTPMNNTVAPGIPTTSHSNTINNNIRNEEQRNRLIFAWIVPFLDIHDLSNLCLASRDLCALIRADLFRHVVLRDITAAAAFCRTILEDPVVVDLDEVPLSERDVLDGGCGFGGFGGSVARTIKVLGWHVRSMKLSFPLDGEYR